MTLLPSSMCAPQVIRTVRRTCQDDAVRLFGSSGLGGRMTRKRDIIGELISGDLSVRDVDRLYDELGPYRVQRSWLLSRVEWTAFAHGASWRDLARWRMQGWPRICHECRRALPPPRQYGWFVVPRSGGRSGIVHIPCLRKDHFDDSASAHKPKKGANAVEQWVEADEARLE
jgi:hypothetical protein